MLKGLAQKRRVAAFGSLSAVIAAMVMLTLAISVPMASAHAQTSHTVYKTKTPKFDVGIHHTDFSRSSQALLSGAITSIPYWSSSFYYGGTTYPYQMVGANPATHPDTSISVKTWLVPVKVTFQGNSTVLDGRAGQTATARSPLFLNSNYSEGRTTYPDAVQRGEWWSYVQGHNYHITLGNPIVQPVLFVTVPIGEYTIDTSSGFPVGEVDANWWDSYIQTHGLFGRNTPNNVFPIFLTYNVVLTSGGCCIIGYHNAVFQPSSSTKVDTYAWGSYMQAGFFDPSTGIQDVNALSHEVAEWVNDPFTDNIVPNWSVASEPQYGCNNLLEVGDPLVGVYFIADTAYGSYHMQDEAYFSWFAHQSTSKGYGGLYSFRGTFTTPPTVC